MRILLVCDYFLKYTGSFAIALSAQGNDVAVVCRAHAGEFGGDFAEREQILASVREAGCRVFEVPGRLRSLGSVPQLIALRKTVADWGPEVVHVQDNHDPRLALLTGRAPHVLTIHDPTPHVGARSLSALRSRFRKIWLRRASLIILHSDDLRRRFIDAHHPRAPLAVVPHGANPLPAPLPVPAEPTVLLFGRLEAYKGLSVLLEAMSSVWRAQPSTRLIIAGTGPEARLVPDDARIEFSNRYVPESSLDDLFARASVSVLPYIEASQSGAGLESLRRGIPTIVTRVGSLPELVHDDQFVVGPGEPECLASSVVVSLEHDAALRQRVLEHVRHHFSWDAVASATSALYADLLEGRRNQDHALPRLVRS